MNKVRIVEIEWVDACSNSGWIAQKEAEEWIGVPYACKTVGYLVSSTKEQVTVAATYSECDGKLNGLHQVPRGMVKRMRFL